MLALVCMRGTNIVAFTVREPIRLDRGVPVSLTFRHFLVNLLIRRITLNLFFDKKIKPKRRVLRHDEKV